MKKVLWISWCAPYDSVPHAGGKIENFYLKSLNSSGKYDIRMITFAHKEEMSKIDLDSYNISYDAIIHHYKGAKHLVWGAMSKLRKSNPFSKNGGFTPPYGEYKLKKAIKRVKDEGFAPNIIILQWTQIVLYIEYIRMMFPNIPIVSVEEDISFLSYFRQYGLTKTLFTKLLWKEKFERLKICEERCLENSNLVILNNYKDSNLIAMDGIVDNVWVWTPYFQRYTSCNYSGNKSRDILFYGAMSRDENWKSALWFIDNVMPLLDDMRFVIVGNKPPKQLLDRASDNICITGFVNDVRPFFEKSLCLVAPLVFGAGVKIKILEAMSAGIPILTNQIGIEGIDAKDGCHYIHCESANDYLQGIRKLASGIIDPQSISIKCRQLTEEKYDFEKSANEFSLRIDDLCKEGYK